MTCVNNSTARGRTRAHQPVGAGFDIFATSTHPPLLTHHQLAHPRSALTLVAALALAGGAAAQATSKLVWTQHEECEFPAQHANAMRLRTF